MTGPRSGPAGRLGVAIAVLALAGSACTIVDAPVALDDAYVVEAGDEVELDVTANDYLSPARPAAMDIVTDPDQLDPRVEGRRVLVLIPGGFTEGRFRYELDDGEARSAATVELTTAEVRLTLAPAEATGRAGGPPQEVAVVVEGRLGNAPFEPIAGAEIEMELRDNSAGATLSATACRTDPAGRCPVAVTAEQPGTAELQVRAGPSSIGGLVLEGRTATAPLRWVDARLVLPGEVLGGVGELTGIEAVLEVDDGSGPGFRPRAGVPVDFTVLTGTATFRGPASCTTADDGRCTVRALARLPSEAVVGAEARFTIAGVRVELEAETLLRWIGLEVGLEAAVDVEVIGTPVELTATVEQDDGTGSGPLPLDGAQVRFELIFEDAAVSFAPGSGDECRTEGGECTTRVVASTAGPIGVRAVASVPVNGATLEDEVQATVTWVDLRLTVPATLTRPVSAVLEARVQKHEGAGLVGVPGATVAFAFAAGGPQGTFPDGARCTTGSAGTCEVTVVSPQPATVESEVVVRILGRDFRASGTTRVSTPTVTPTSVP